LAEVLMNMGQSHMEEAEHWMKEAISCDAKKGTMWYLASDHALYAEWFRRQGNMSAAREGLGSAIAIFRECGADGWVTKYEEEMARL
jgi:hypothetical protein